MIMIIILSYSNNSNVRILKKKFRILERYSTKTKADFSFVTTYAYRKKKKIL